MHQPNIPLPSQTSPCAPSTEAYRGKVTLHRLLLHLNLHHLLLQRRNSALDAVEHCALLRQSRTLCCRLLVGLLLELAILLMQLLCELNAIHWTQAAGPLNNNCVRCPVRAWHVPNAQGCALACGDQCPPKVDSKQNAAGFCKRHSAPAFEPVSILESAACSCLRSLTVPASLVLTSAFFLSMSATPF